jgi:hypothetical protein
MVSTRQTNKIVSYATFFKKSSVPYPAKNVRIDKAIQSIRVPNSLSFFVKSFQTYIISNLNRKNQVSFIREIDTRLLNFLKIKYGLCSHFTDFHEFVRDYNLITEQFSQNCLNNENNKFQIKPGSLQIKLLRKSKCILKLEDENKKLKISNFVNNRKIKVTFLKESINRLTNPQRMILDDFIQRRLANREI